MWSTSGQLRGLLTRQRTSAEQGQTRGEQHAAAADDHQNDRYRSRGRSRVGDGLKQRERSWLVIAFLSADRSLALCLTTTMVIKELVVTAVCMSIGFATVGAARATPGDPAVVQSKLGSSQRTAVKPTAKFVLKSKASARVGTQAKLLLTVTKGVKGQKVTLEHKGPTGGWKKATTTTLKKSSGSTTKPVTFTHKLAGYGTHSYRVKVAKKGKVAATTSKTVAIMALPVPPSAPFAKQSTGSWHSCAITTSGALYCWGHNAWSQLGLGNSITVWAPVRVGAGSNWSTVDAGGIHTCAINAGHELYCWGGNPDGQLGLGDKTDRSVPTRVGTASNWASVSVGSFHTCATTTTGYLYCWGDGRTAQLGVGDQQERLVPTLVGANWHSVDAADRHTCGIRTTGTLYCWGDNDRGQVGLGVLGGGVVKPTQIGTATNWATISVNVVHSCATTSGGALYCWGYNLYGELGDGSTTDQYSPTLVSSSGWASVAASNMHTCGITTAGALYCWGANLAGGLGISSLTHAKLPTRVGTGTNWSSVSAFEDSTCGITTGKQLWCWGKNTSGKLGLGDTKPRWSPTLVHG